MRINEITASTSPRQQAIPTPPASVKPALTLSQQKQAIQNRKIKALVQQYANSELAQQGKVTDLDKVEALMTVGNLRSKAK